MSPRSTYLHTIREPVKKCAKFAVGGREERVDRFSNHERSDFNVRRFVVWSSVCRCVCSGAQPLIRIPDSDLICQQQLPQLQI